MPIVVYVGKHDNIEKAIKRLTKTITKEGVLTSYKNKLFFEKPSMRARKNKKRAISRIVKDARDN